MGSPRRLIAWGPLVLRLKVHTVRYATAHNLASSYPKKGLGLLQMKTKCEAFYKLTFFYEYM